MSDGTRIKLHIYQEDFLEEAERLIRSMIKAIYVNGGELLGVSDPYCSVNERFNQLDTAYRIAAEQYTEPIDEAERLLASLKQKHSRIILENCEALQGRLNMEDCYNEFFVQLSFLLARRMRVRSDYSFFSGGCSTDGQYVRMIADGNILRIDCYGGGSMNDRYEWIYDDGFEWEDCEDGFPAEPKHTCFAAKVVKIYVPDISAFRGDPEIVEKAVSIQRDTLGRMGRFRSLLPSAEPIVRVMIEADTAELCDRAMEEFLSFLREKGYGTL